MSSGDRRRGVERLVAPIEVFDEYAECLDVVGLAGREVAAQDKPVEHGGRPIVVATGAKRAQRELSDKRQVIVCDGGLAVAAVA